MTTCENESAMWSNVLEFLNLSDVGKCASISSRLNQSVRQHLRQVPTTVQIVHHCTWKEAVPLSRYPWEGLQGSVCPSRGMPIVYLNRDRPFTQLLHTIVCALQLSHTDSYAVDIIYRGLLVGRVQKCNPPTFTTPASKSTEIQHIDVAINFPYLEWQYLMQQIPLESWISELSFSYEARLFDEGKLQGSSTAAENGDYTYQWHHPEWNPVTQEWYAYSRHGPTPMSSRPMRQYLQLRTLEANLRRQTSSRYGGKTTELLVIRRSSSWQRGTPAGPDRSPRPPHRDFQWTILYDSNGQMTFPGASNSPRVRETHAEPKRYFNRYPRWWDLPVPQH